MASDNTRTNALVETEAPLYIRWGPDRSLYAIELRLDLVDRIRKALSSAQGSHIEIGGVLIGSLPTAYSPTIRIEDIELIDRSPHDGATFMLDPGQHDRFSEVRWKSRSRERVAVGLFRSHLRPGLLRPSLADRTLLSNEFTGPIYALLLVQGKEPFHAGIFVAAHGQLPVEPSVNEFTWEDADFRALPEIDPETTPLPALPTYSGISRPWSILSALALAGLGALGIWEAPQLGVTLPVLGAPSDVDLNVTSSSNSIQITWNHRAPLINHATGGTLSVQLPSGERTMKVPTQELKAGTIVLESAGPSGEATLILDQPGQPSIRQTVYWRNP